MLVGFISFCICCQQKPFITTAHTQNLQNIQYSLPITYVQLHFPRRVFESLSRVLIYNKVTVGNPDYAQLFTRHTPYTRLFCRTSTCSKTFTFSRCQSPSFNPTYLLQKRYLKLLFKGYMM